jgi:hypothetical protein
VGDLDAYLRSIAAAGRGKDPHGIKAGHIEGLRETGPARLAPAPDEPIYHHAGYLSGHLTRWMAERGREIDPAMLLLVAAYAGAVADPAGQRSFDKPDGPLAVHTYAAIRTEKKHDQALSDSDERMMFGWLLEQSDRPAPPALIAKMERMRRRRHDRTGR